MRESDGDDDAAAAGVAAAGAAVAPWVAPWGEPEHVETVGERSERLGVLPSPTATAYSVADGWDPSKGGRSRQGSHIEDVIREDSAEARDERNGDVYEELQRGWGTDSEADAPSTRAEGADRPTLARGESDRAFLPSQLKSSSVPQSPRSPRSPGRMAGEEDEELYESTPRQMQFPRMAGSSEENAGEGGKTPVVGAKTTDAFVGADLGAGADGRPQLPPAREDSAFDLAGRQGCDEREEAPGTSGAQGAAGFNDPSLPLSSTSASNPTPAPDAKAEVAPSAQEWDKRSAVSSEDNFHDAQAEEETDFSNTAHSRRSSVSSLGDPATMTAQAVPSGPVTTQLHEAREARDTVQQQQGFMNRSYRSGAERPMSYMPLGTTPSGVPVQETIDRSDPAESSADLSGMTGPPARELPSSADQAEDTSVDLSGMSGPPVGVQPYQIHPAIRDPEGGLTGDHGGLRSPPPAPDAPPVVPTRPAMYNRQVSAETKDRSSKRMSGFFRSRQSSQVDTTKVYGPAPSTISDQYGLEDLPTGPAAVVRPETQASGEARQTKRRSGIWNSFKRSSVVFGDESRQSRNAAMPSQAEPFPDAVEEPPRNTPPPQINTLKKTPQRATTNAAPSEPIKKKRFSGLGSLFGRSSTTGHKSERPRKLVKQQSTTSRETSATYMPAATSSVATGYEAFEEARRREARENRRPKSPQIGPPQPERVDLSTAAIQFPYGQGHDTAATTPPPDGWYAGRDEQEQQFRKLHSERERAEFPLQNVPEAFRPVEASFAGRVDAVGPPLPHSNEPMLGRVASPLFSPPPTQRAHAGGYYRPSGAAPPQRRHMSYGSNEYQLSPQVSGQSEYRHQQDWRHRGSLSSISPMHSRTGSESFLQPRHVRMGSLGQEIARGPPHQSQQQGFGDQQQRPWAVSMPGSGEEGPRGGTSEPIAAAYGGVDDYPPYDDYNYAQGPYPQMQVSKQRTPGPTNSPPPAMQYGRGPYPSPPYSPGPAPHQRGGPYPSGPQHQRYYSLPTYDQGPPPGQSQMPRHFNSGGPPVQPQRPVTSEYVGRRDEPALGEEDLEAQMRGSSYPGQEWTPGRWD